MTRLAFIADKVMEWLWLAAIVFTPLFFNVYSSRVFEPDKLSLLRTIVLFAVLAWAIKLIEQISAGRSNGARVEQAPWWRVPLLLPILLYALWYLVTSAFSVTPSASIYGSYQRLQGLFSQYAYIMLALVIAFNVRTRAQVERLVTFMILTAVPVSLYGVIQHYKLDPLPWAGDVSDRVASTMGNSIFVGAWQIMVVPLILYRIVSLIYRLRQGKDSDLEATTSGDDWLMVLGYAVTAAVQSVILWFALLMIAANQRPDFGLWFILPTAITVFYLLNYVYGTARSSSRVFAYAQLGAMAALFLLVCLTIYWTHSRGPLAGLVASLALFGLGVLAFLLRRRWLLNLGGLAVAGVLALTLIAPFAADLIKAVPGLNKLDTEKIPFLAQGRESTTAQVRKLIWEGAVGLISSGPGRALVGYGPESMYVAYNKYYPADLAHVELRNATPDRSHNAYLDQLINGGFVMLVLYLLMIGTFFFFVWRSIRRSESLINKTLLLALASGVAAHLIEVSVGIQIAATYTYFYTYMGLFIAFAVFVDRVLVENERPRVQAEKANDSNVLSRILTALKPGPGLVPAMAMAGSSAPANMMFASNTGRQTGGNSRAPRSSRTARSGQPASGGTTSVTPADMESLPASNGNATGNPDAVKAASPRSSTAAPRPDAPKADPRIVRPNQSTARRQVAPSAKANRTQVGSQWIANPVNLAIYAAIAAVVLYLTISVNVNLVHADMLYKQGLSADAQSYWPQSVQIYDQAIKEQPDQDYYYLFMGRAYMEWSKAPQRFPRADGVQWDQTSTTQAQSQLILKAEETLKKALTISPMNTDHYANLARLYLYWGGQVTSDPAKLKQGVDSFRKATELSPQNAQLWNERAQAERGYALLLNAIAAQNVAATSPITSTGVVTPSGSVTNTGTISPTTAPVVPAINPEAKTWLLEAEKSIRHTIDNVDPVYDNSYPIWADIERGLGNPQLNVMATISGTLINPSVFNDNSQELKARAQYLVDNKTDGLVIDALKLVTTPRNAEEEKQWLVMQNDLLTTRDFVKVRDTAAYWKGGQAKNANAYNFLGYIYWVKNDLAASAAALEQSVAIDGGQYNVMRLAVGHYSSLGKPQDELRLLQKMVAILNDPNAVNSVFQGDSTAYQQEKAQIQARVTQLGGSPAAPAQPAQPLPGLPGSQQP